MREAVLALRRGKGMVLDGEDRDTWSVGSFFTNPILDPAALPEGAPAFPQPDGTVKTSAAWLIERAGFHRGYGDPATVAISSKHTLALTNRGAGRRRSSSALAREIAGGVRGALRRGARAGAGLPRGRVVANGGSPRAVRLYNALHQPLALAGAALVFEPVLLVRTA